VEGGDVVEGDDVVAVEGKEDCVVPEGDGRQGCYGADFEFAGDIFEGDRDAGRKSLPLAYFLREGVHRLEQSHSIYTHALRMKE
jgi:hypothetical protein